MSVKKRKKNSIERIFFTFKTSISNKRNNATTYLNQVFLFIMTTNAFNLAELNFFNLWYVSQLKEKYKLFFFLSFHIFHCSLRIFWTELIEFIAANSKISLILKTKLL